MMPTGRSGPPQKADPTNEGRRAVRLGRRTLQRRSGSAAANGAAKDVALAAEGVELDGGDGFGGDGHFAFKHGVLEVFRGGGETGIGIHAVEAVAFGFWKSDELDAAGAIEIEEFREHLGVEGADVHEQDVGDVTLVEGLGKPAIEIEIGACGVEIGGLKLSDGSVVGLGDAACVGIVPLIIVEIHGDGGDFVAALGEECANAVVFGGSIAFRKIGEAEPVPVLMFHQLGEERFVAGDIGFEVFERILVEIHVRPGVAAERVAGGAPGLEDGKFLGVGFKSGGVDEAVGGRDMRVMESGDDFAGDLEASFAGRERAVGGEIVESEGDAGVGVGGRSRGRIWGRSLGVRKRGRKEKRNEREGAFE